MSVDRIQLTHELQGIFTLESGADWLTPKILSYSYLIYLAIFVIRMKNFVDTDYYELFCVNVSLKNTINNLHSA